MFSTVPKSLAPANNCQSNDIKSSDSFDTYDFDADENFQFGMTQILGDSAQEGKSAEELLQVAKQYYFYNFVENYPDHGQAFQERFSINGPIIPTCNEQFTIKSAPRASLSDIVQLINEGKPIPGIRTIPNIINSESPSHPRLSPRPKPWEKATQ